MPQGVFKTSRGDGGSETEDVAVEVLSSQIQDASRSRADRTHRCTGRGGSEDT